MVTMLTANLIKSGTAMNMKVFQIYIWVSGELIKKKGVMS